MRCSHLRSGRDCLISRLTGSVQVGIWISHFVVYQILSHGSWSWNHFIVDGGLVLSLTKCLLCLAFIVIKGNIPSNAIVSRDCSMDKLSTQWKHEHRWWYGMIWTNKSPRSLVPPFSKSFLRLASIVKPTLSRLCQAKLASTRLPRWKPWHSWIYPFMSVRSRLSLCSISVPKCHGAARFEEGIAQLRQKRCSIGMIAVSLRRHASIYIFALRKP